MHGHGGEGKRRENGCCRRGIHWRRMHCEQKHPSVTREQTLLCSISCASLTLNTHCQPLKHHEFRNSPELRRIGVGIIRLGTSPPSPKSPPCILAPVAKLFVSLNPSHGASGTCVQNGVFCGVDALRSRHACLSFRRLVS